MAALARCTLRADGIGSEADGMMLDPFQLTKNMLVSYNPKKLGFFLSQTCRTACAVLHRAQR